MFSRAKDCLLGQLAGDSLDSLFKFRAPEQICLKDFYNRSATLRLFFCKRPSVSPT